jgi:general secretion pathway protein A
MYLNHYNLRQKPFSISPDPKFLWFSENHKEALAVLKYGILDNRGFLLLTGDIGTGKTALINALVKKIDVAALVATIPDPGLSSLDFFNFLSEEFEMNRHFDTKGDFLIHFKHFLYRAYEGNRNVLLIIDEAQRLDHEMLEQVRLLSNIEMQNRKLINIFFVGQSEFNEMLLDEKNKAVRQRITASYHLDPLTDVETVKYIQHRLKVAGAEKDIFTAGAIREVFSCSQGNPRLINIICDHALLTGYSSGVTLIDKEIISECANELHITGDIIDLIDNSPSPDKTTKDSDLIRKSQKQKMAVSVIAMLLLGIVGYFMYNFQLDESPQWGMEDIAKKKNLILSQEEKNALIAKISEESRAQKKESVAETHAKQTDVKNKDLSATKDTTVEKDAAYARRGIENKNVLVSGSPNITQYPGQKTVVHFKHNSNEIPDQAFESLKRIVRLASKNPESEIIVEGYTDSFGNYQYNKKLSKFRADIIKSYFAGQGIPVSRIKTYGMGPENPIATNNTFEGRKKNRRVEIRINSKE